MMKNIKIFFSVLICTSIVLVACQGKKADASTDQAPVASTTPAATETPAAPAAAPVNEAGKKIFETYCILCHGADGKLGLNGAKDLTISTITMEERITQITNGKGTMTPFKGTLTEEEIQAVAEFTQSLKQ